MKISIKTLGCKLNQAESDELKENLQNEGFFIADWKHKADIYIVNACGLTAGAEQGTRQIIRQAKHQNSKAKIFVTGCFKQKIPEVDSYIKNHIELVKKIKKIKKSDNLQLTTHNLPQKNHESRTRAFIKIQTGCDNFCSYCIIPYFRGKPKSVSAEKIISIINRKVDQGFKEIVLTGVNICKYDSPHCLRFDAAVSKCKQSLQLLNLTKLVQKILKETKVQRIRFGSLDPVLIDDNFIALFRHPRIMPHMHLSLQSGSNRILKLMNRKYTAEHYLSLVKKIKKQFPLIGFTTDIIIGFPSETEKDFRDTCNLIKKVGFLKIHAFPFSPRPDTQASQMLNQIDEKIKKERFKCIKKIADFLNRKFAQKMVGQTAEVLFEEKKGGFWFGYAPNYLRLRLKSKENLKNKIKNIVISQKNII